MQVEEWSHLVTHAETSIKLEFQNWDIYVTLKNTGKYIKKLKEDLVIRNHFVRQKKSCFDTKKKNKLYSNLTTWTKHKAGL